MPTSSPIVVKLRSQGSSGVTYATDISNPSTSDNDRTTIIDAGICRPVPPSQSSTPVTGEAVFVVV